MIQRVLRQCLATQAEKSSNVRWKSRSQGLKSASRKMCLLLFGLQVIALNDLFLTQPTLSCSLASSHQARTLFILLFQCRTCKFGHFVCVGRQKLSPSSADPQIQDALRGTTHRREDDLNLAIDMVINRVAEMVCSLFHTSRIAHDFRTEYATHRCI